MRRAVITGLGIVSCIGVDKKAVEESLRKGTLMKEQGLLLDQEDLQQKTYLLRIKL